MDNNELSIQQLQGMAGGAQIGDNSFEYLGDIVLANTVREHVRKNAEPFQFDFNRPIPNRNTK
ncbi:hypothetical protein PMIT1313_02396 [Prochlorococcus marinus str. MIT 1313]|uniref:CCRG-2 family RiPP n=1 Tax=Prochlorococcus TaxID=1218 RepID=UPI0007B3AAB8|nr:hypothetical protein PMIT1313_02396 [Prochlorococcus marinus str. MIT 1313]